MAAQNATSRLRFNFREYVRVEIDGALIRSSAISALYVRVAAIQIDGPTGNNWVLLTPPRIGAVNCDNEMGQGTTKLSWNLL